MERKVKKTAKKEDKRKTRFDDTARYQRSEKAAKEVMLLASFGITQEEIAEYLDIGVETLRKLYSRELKIANTNATKNVATRLYHKAVVQDDLKAQIFWLRTRAKWSEKDAEEENKNISIAEKLIDKLMEKASI